MSNSAKRPLQPSILRHNKRIRSTAQPSPAYCGWKEHDAIGRALLLPLVGHTGSEQSEEDPTAGMSTEEALERVAVWKMRSPKIAHAVESTAALAQILLREKSDDDLSRRISTTELRLAYSCAILRAINGLADTLQQQRSMASSVAVLCSELGVPAWLVAIRHEATHNQLPPLPTLRMAANALLQYFSTVYWEPMLYSRQDSYDQAVTLLREYEAAAIEVENTRNHRKTTTTNNEDEEDIRIDDDSSSSDDKEAMMLDGLWQPIPGTTSNRFALLLDDKPKKKKGVPPKLTTKKSEETVKKKQAVTPRNPEKPTPSECAQKYVKAKIPIDIAYCAALDFLFLGSSADLGQGVLVAGDFESLMHRYRLFISILGRTWPGFLCALLIACVDQLLLTENYSRSPTEDTVSSDKCCQALELWVRYLLSRKFLGQFDSSIKAENKGVERDIAPLSLLKAMQFPLNRLCDRCSSISNKNVSVGNRNSASYRLVELFTAILGTERSANYGIDLSPKDSLEPDTAAKVAVQATPEPTQLSAAAMSLEAMEALLSGDAGAAALVPKAKSDDVCVATSNNPGQIVVTAAKLCPTWVRCTSWEPCAIGALP